jgi:hypothetical protein
VAVGTQGLQVGRVIVPAVTVYVVYVQLAAVLRHKATVQAGVLLVDGVWVFILHTVAAIDSLAPVSTSQAFSPRVS